MSDKWLVGGTILVPQLEQSYDPGFMAIGMTATSLRPGRVGPDLSFVVVPRGLQIGALVGGARVNAGLPVALSPAVLIVPSAGASVLGAAGLVGIAGVVGVNATVALNFFPAGSQIDEPSTVGLRVALGQHRFSGAGGSVTFLEFGVVRR